MPVVIIMEQRYLYGASAFLAPTSSQQFNNRARSSVSKVTGRELHAFAKLVPDCAGIKKCNASANMPSDIGRDERQKLIDQDLHLTRTVMPELARTQRRDWPVRNDYCFQRIVLDSVASGIWYEHIPQPAYKHVNRDQAQRAVSLCENIISGLADLVKLNRGSLSWRGK